MRNLILALMVFTIGIVTPLVSYGSDEATTTKSESVVVDNVEVCTSVTAVVTPTIEFCFEVDFNDTADVSVDNTNAYAITSTTLNSEANYKVTDVGKYGYVIYILKDYNSPLEDPYQSNHIGKLTYREYRKATVVKDWPIAFAKLE